MWGDENEARESGETSRRKWNLREKNHRCRSWWRNIGWCYAVDLLLSLHYGGKKMVLFRWCELYLLNIFLSSWSLITVMLECYWWRKWGWEGKAFDGKWRFVFMCLLGWWQVWMGVAVFCGSFLCLLLNRWMLGVEIERFTENLAVEDWFLLQKFTMFLVQFTPIIIATFSNQWSPEFLSFFR
jgi:hypothetical protein